ncbi:PB1 domain, RWP-RK domain, Lambda repressor-like, DNA-binding domain protein [Artemisia annua]|uniref:PB1 domain, RWP-RK domain, Lambda repressor-like, DNA-binding domain protein n=1 Tax=Artemisia annua TaxID=35608 RepID=A0A2U1KGM9_ARTAN|nr:PB1 domain, RWP-RK domain, Lambda repressor-like, DNA-binding domain protein [Artemisia annua]
MSFRVPHVLVQFWSPITVRKQCLLKTLDQPFGLGVVDEALYSYRLASEERMCVVDVEHIEEFGSPGRVYRQKLPEWSLDVHTLPARHPAQYNTHGYITLPVFEPDSGFCVGVLEIITSSNCVDYTFEVQEVSRALKEENLKSPNVFEDYSFYALCGHSSAMDGSGNLVKSCSSFNSHCIGKVCMSTYGLPFYVRDLKMWGFHEACRERHLVKSHGVVGRSLSSCGICICEDVTKLGEDEYPLVSYARDNGITSCLAIYLKSIKRDVEYVIELVLPSHKTNEVCLQSLVKTLKLHIKNVSSVKFGNMSSPLVIGGDTHDWNLESPSPSPITLLTETEEVLPEPVNRQVLVENELIDVNDVTVSEDQYVVDHVEHKEDD